MDIYLNDKQTRLIKEVIDAINTPITYHGFLVHIKNFLGNLLKDPANAKVDDYLLKYGLYKAKLLQKLLKRGIIIRDEKIIEIEGEKPKFSIKYKVLRMDFDKKLRRMFAELCEVNLPEHKPSPENIDECDSIGGGATSAAAVNASAPIAPLSKPIRRKVYMTREQAEYAKKVVEEEKMNEATTTAGAGNYQYDVPFTFKPEGGGKDPSMIHRKPGGISCERLK